MIRVRREKVTDHRLRHRTILCGAMSTTSYEAEESVVGLQVRTKEATFTIEIPLHDLLKAASFGLGCFTDKKKAKRK